MPQIFLIAAVGTVALAGYKLVRREMERVGRTLGELRETELGTPVARATLVRCADGIYRPADRRD